MVDMLSCFTTGTFGDMECFLVNGFGALFGGPEFLTIVTMAFSLILTFKLKLPPDLAVVWNVALLLVATTSFAPEWLFWAVLIAVLTMAGWGLYKWANR